MPKDKKSKGKDKSKKKEQKDPAEATSRDLIVIDSSKVGSPAREGEILEVIHGDVRVSYRVQWPDGHQSVVAPMLGSARIVPASRRATGRSQA